MDAYEKAYKVVSSSIARLGGNSNFGKIESIELNLNGTAYDEGQSLSPSSEWHQREMNSRVIYKPKESTSYQSINTLTIGGLLYDPSFIIQDNGTGLQNQQSTNEWFELTEFEISILKSIPQLYPPRLFPFVVLGNAIRNAQSLRYIGLIEGGHNISVSDSDGSVITLIIDESTRLLNRIEMVSDHLVFGDVNVGIQYEDYVGIDSVFHPQKLRFTYNSKPFMELEAQVKLNTNSETSLFEKPDEIEFTELPGPFKPKEIVDGVWLMPVFSGLGITYNVMMIELEDYIILIDAPLFDGYSRGIQQVSNNISPGKPIKYVVASHYHTDHIGGINYFISKQVPIISNIGNEDFIKEVARVKHTVFPNSQMLNPSEAIVESFKKKRSFKDEKREVVLYEINGSPHVDEMILVYLPNERILFVADLLMSSYQNPTPMYNESLDYLIEFVKKNKLEVDIYVPSHGKILSAEKLRR